MAFAATRRCAQRSWHMPTSVHFAPWGEVEEVMTRVIGQRKVLLITYPQAEVTGLWTSLISTLGDTKCTLSRMFIAAPELPDLNEFRGLYRRVRNFVADRDDIVILAVGGGSCIDLAKVMSLAKSGVEFDQILEQRITRGKRINALAHVPVVAVPTTAGTGSEVTPWAAMWDIRNKKKYSVQGHSLWPEAAIVDPSLAVSCPPEVTRNCGLDALCHALEALWNRNHNPVSDTLAVSAARGVLLSLPRVLVAAEAGGDKEKDKGKGDEGLRAARTLLSLSANRAGLAFSNTETALCHAISYDLTMGKGVKHGVACAFSLPRVLKMAYGHDPGRDALLREVFRGMEGGDPDKPWEALEGFLHRVGVSTALADYGIEGEEDFARRAQEGMKQRRGRNFILAGGSE